MLVMHPVRSELADITIAANLAEDSASLNAVATSRGLRDTQLLIGPRTAF